ncbi:PilX N-terminal domain-containing pilus assembly protein [Paraglaciecola sp. MB-3u-78]|uniref:pilus assembly PilX family protein n=1 Tax=Paraglaciecola sp. MB-3u-78 TaxID=2058332 RepID=UPI000C33562F|nr:PilX N-terminal domain-containing pilus assembly protein [Paraglaciecola sp. MB-3u-78]PKH00919.1 pilus assembly protein PilZ [Paraglaciecola sp. MB-3u-78]
MNNLSKQKNSGMVLVFALLILMSLTILGVSSVSSSLMQSKMAISMEKRSLSFDAAESAIAAVMFESEDEELLSNVALDDPLSAARGGNFLDLTVQTMSCFEDVTWTNRVLTNAGLSAGTQHVSAGNYTDKPVVKSWSRAAFVREQPCVGSSNVIGGSNISCHIFIVRGCGQLDGSNYAVANSVNASVFAPATQ